jgi:hypothetical protein
MKRPALILLALLLATVRADQTISTPTTYAAGSSLTIQSGVPLAGTWNFAGATVSGLPAAPVTSVFGRSGTVAATTGDYTAAQVTNAVSTASTYANPTWLTALAWSKITGAPAFEPALGNPTTNGYVLSSTTAGARSWIALAAANGLPTGGTAAQVLSKNSGTNYDASWATLSSATFQSGMSNPTGTTATTPGVMVGLAYTITPVRSGKVFVSICGTLLNNAATGGALVRIHYGTGTAPANGATLAGTAIGAYGNSTSAGVSYRLPFTVTAVITGLTLNTAIWFDLEQGTGGSGGTASILNVAGTAYELP